MSLLDQISAAAIRYGVPPDLALAVAQRESGLNPGAVGAKGEVGLFQLMPATAMSLGVNPYDVQQNIDGGVRYLAQNYQTFGSWDLALAAYNAGPGKVASGNIPPSTQAYVRDILGRGEAPVMTPVGPVFSVDVWGEPWEDFPWWVLAIGAGALVYYLS